MKIAFYQPHCDIRGTGVCYYDYATHNESILGNKSYFLYDSSNHYTHPLAIKKFQKKLETYEIPGMENMDLVKKKCIELGVDALYIQKGGKRDNRFVDGIPTLIHVVGVVNEPHGTVYAYVSDWLSQECSSGKLPVVPYMVNLPENSRNIRDELNIPGDSIVFGRYGGPETFNISFVYDVVLNILNARDDVYFIFANTNKFIDHPRAVFIEPFADLDNKRMFINTCDAMIHARHEGESFGAAVAEFSFCNKPVITFADSRERNHIVTLGDKGLYYSTPETLYNILYNFNKSVGDWNAYRDFTPEIVMGRFKKVFLDSL